MRSHLVLLSILTLVLILLGPSAHAVTLTNGGFEVPEAVQPSLPTTFGDWAGDGGTIVQSEQGLVPAEGSRMLRFDFTFLGGWGAGTSSDQWQLIDMSTLSQEIAAGQVTLSASAQFNRVSRDEQTDSEFLIGLSAFSGVPGSFNDPNVLPLTNAITAILTDTNEASWEAASVDLPLPPGTTYVGLSVSAVENVMNDLTFPEFDGHYVDDVQIATNISVSEPPSIVSVSAEPAVLWPPNNKLTCVNISAVVEGGVGESDWEVVGVSNDENNDAGDFQFCENDPHSVLLLATRSGDGDGRTYSVKVRATDASGNQSDAATVKVDVPHDQRNNKH